IIWDYHNLEQVWKVIASWHETPQVFLLVDALDESDQHHLSEFLSLLLDHRGASTSVIKIVLASRPIEMVEKRLKGAFHIVLEDENRRDIATLIDAQLAFLGDDTDPLTDWTKKYLNDHAQGVFLWVTIVIRELKVWVEKGCSEAEIKNDVQSFPLELVAYYTQIVQRLAHDSPESQEQTRKMIDWVTYAERPVTAAEFWDIIAVPSNPDEACKLSAHSFQTLKLRRFQDLEKRIRRHCGDFIEIRGHTGLPNSKNEPQPRTIDSQDVVQLLHQTVREFLTRPDKIARPLDTNELRATTMIAITCIHYIKHSFRAVSSLNEDSFWSQYALKWPEDHHQRLVKHLEPRFLLLYALRYLPRHLRRVALAESPVWRIMCDYFEEIQKDDCHAFLVQGWFKELDFHSDRPKMSDMATSFRISSLMAAVKCGTASVVRALIELQPILDCVHDRTDMTVLQAAAALGDWPMVSLLLDRAQLSIFAAGISVQLCKLQLITDTLKSYKTCSKPVQT
ncbi:hypothetical protein BDV97DRAFT_410455, partial [Delphinella strobiligena]